MDKSRKMLCLRKSSVIIMFFCIHTDFVKHMYPDNPGAVHDNLPKLFDSLDRFEGTDMAGIYLIVVLVSERHPEVNSTVIFILFPFFPVNVEKTPLQNMPVMTDRQKLLL